MASELLSRCYHCGLPSTQNTFKYFDNKKADQPRYQCHECKKLFTLGSHGRPQGRTYAKKRNEDPEELRGLSRHCRHCGVADCAPFKYYNNRNPSQPRFKCLSCGKQFQMRLLGTGAERRLVHTSAMHERPARARRRKTPPEMTQAPMSGDDVQFSNFLEAELADHPEEGNITYYEEADPLIYGNWPAGSDGVTPFLRFEEMDITHQYGAPNADNALSPSIPPSVQSKDATMPSAGKSGNAQYTELLCFTESQVVDSANTGDSATDPMHMHGEVMYGTRVSSDRSSRAAPACASSDDCSASASLPRAVSTVVFATDPFRVLPEMDLFRQSMMEDEQDSEFQWVEEDEMEEPFDLWSAC